MSRLGSRSRSPPRGEGGAAGVNVALDIALRWSDDVVAAVTFKRWTALHSLVSRASRLIVSKDILKESGIGFLIADRTIWEHGDDGVKSAADVTMRRWKRVAHDVVQPVGDAYIPKQPRVAGEPVKRPLGGLKSTQFLEKVMSVQLQLEELAPHIERGVREAAAQIVFRGFSQIQDLEGLEVEVVEMWSSKPAVQAVLIRASEGAAKLAMRRAARAKEVADVGLHGGCPRLGVTPLSAGTMASTFDVLDVEESVQQLGKQFEDAGMLEFMEGVKPSDAARKVTQAFSRGENPLVLLDRKARLLQVATREKSIGQVCSALRAWHGWALCLGYGEESTLPPRSPQDVLLWAATFKNAGTARNYLSVLSWACKLEGLDQAWFGENLTILLKGFQKVSLTNVAKIIHDRQLLDTKTVHGVVALSDKLEATPKFAICVLTSWELLSRVQSESLKLECGVLKEIKELPGARHSAVVVQRVAEGAQALFRFARRKNKPEGSILKRKCACGGGMQFCLVHRLETFLGKSSVGQRLFDFTGPEFQAKLRRYLKLLQIPEADEYTLKAFRAGKATEMAGKGFTLRQILDAGEWRSRSLLNYVQEDRADEAEVLRQSIVLSDDEDDVTVDIGV